jgi:ABC-type amino acid transport system permease subunit
MNGTREVRTGPLWVVTLVLSVLLVGGSLIAYDLPAARMFGVLGGLSLPLVSLLHNLDS